MAHDWLGPKTCLEDDWLGPRHGSVNGYNTVLEIQRKICKDGRQVRL